MGGEDRARAGQVALITLVAVAVVGVIYLALRYANLLLLLFAAILLAVFVDALAQLIVRRTAMRRGWSVLVVWVVIFAVLVGLGFLGGPRIADQTTALSERVSEATSSIRQYLDGREWGQWLLNEASRFGGRLPAGSEIVGRITGFFSTAISWIVGLGVVVVLAVYLSAAPRVYVDNLLRLIPQSRRERFRDVVGELARSLRWWLIGRFTAMTLLGLLTTIGLLITGVPLAITLGVLAAITAFVPYLGPVMWLVPAVLVAWATGPIKVLWVVVIYGAVQFLEGNFITPLIQQRAVSIPPALLLSVQMFMGVFFGALGVLVATPLAVVVIILVQMLYVEDVLGESVRLLGRRGAG